MSYNRSQKQLPSLKTHYSTDDLVCPTIYRLLKHVDNDEILKRQCGIRRLRSGTSACHHGAGRRNVKDVPHSHKNAREIHAYKPDLFETLCNFSDFF